MTLIGDNGILTRVGYVGEKNTIGEEIEIIKLAYNACKINQTNNEIEKEKMRLEINKYVGDKTTVQEYQTDKIVIAFKDTGNVYILNENKEIEKVDIKVDDDGYVIVEGTADEWKYTVEDGVAIIMKYLGNETEFTIPNYINENANLIKVKCIRGNALVGSPIQGNEKITKVTISEGIEVIERFSFTGFKKLTSINIPSTITKVASFTKCTELQDVKISSSVVCCTKDTFASTKYYNQLKENSQGDGLIYLGKTLVDCVGNSYNFQIKEGTIAVGEGVFISNTILTNIEIPNSVKSIGSSAFKGCTSLISIEIPNSVESIGGSAFQGCTGLTNIIIQEGVKNIGNGTANSNVFSGCTSIKEIIIPSTVEKISLDDFGYMDNLETIILKCKCPEGSLIIEYSLDSEYTIQSEFNISNLKNIYVAPEFLQGYIEYLKKHNYDTSLFKSYKNESQKEGRVPSFLILDNVPLIFRMVMIQIIFGNLISMNSFSYV